MKQRDASLEELSGVINELSQEKAAMKGQLELSEAQISKLTLQMEAPTPIPPPKKPKNRPSTPDV